MSALTEDQAAYRAVGICHLCARKTGLNTCEAFPGGIPVPILVGQVDHHDPYEGDGGKQFTPSQP
jgi:hypothetical protein